MRNDVSCMMTNTVLLSAILILMAKKIWRSVMDTMEVTARIRIQFTYLSSDQKNLSKMKDYRSSLREFILDCFSRIRKRNCFEHIGNPVPVSMGRKSTESLTTGRF